MQHVNPFIHQHAVHGRIDRVFGIYVDGGKLSQDKRPFGNVLHVLRDPEHQSLGGVKRGFTNGYQGVGQNDLQGLAPVERIIAQGSDALRHLIGKVFFF